MGEESRVADFYDRSVENRLWDRLTGGQMHLGYWDDPDSEATLAEASLRLTRAMIGLTAVKPGERFIDIGSGLGIPAMQLAQATGAVVDGVTISPYQQQEAERRAREAGLDSQVRFHVADALAMPFGDATFDGGWFFESIFHMGHLPALREAHRVLKPGAELVLADVVDVGLMTEEALRLAKELCNASYVPTSAYAGLLESTGFELLELRDVTAEVMGPLDARFRSSVSAMRDELLEIADADTLDAFAGVAGQLADTAGYALIRVRRR